MARVSQRKAAVELNHYVILSHVSSFSILPASISAYFISSNPSARRKETTDGKYLQARVVGCLKRCQLCFQRSYI